MTDSRIENTQNSVEAGLSQKFCCFTFAASRDAEGAIFQMYYWVAHYFASRESQTRIWECVPLRETARAAKAMRGGTAYSQVGKAKCKASTRDSNVMTGWPTSVPPRIALDELALAMMESCPLAGDSNTMLSVILSHYSTYTNKLESNRKNPTQHVSCNPALFPFFPPLRN